MFGSRWHPNRECPGTDVSRQDGVNFFQPGILFQILRETLVIPAPCFKEGDPAARPADISAAVFRPCFLSTRHSSNFLNAAFNGPLGEFSMACSKRRLKMRAVCTSPARCCEGSDHGICRLTRSPPPAKLGACL